MTETLQRILDRLAASENLATIARELRCTHDALRMLVGDELTRRARARRDGVTAGGWPTPKCEYQI